jgi:hypothetical protein
MSKDNIRVGSIRFDLRLFGGRAFQRNRDIFKENP